ncbi:MAG: amidase [Bacteroidetes bacterium]|nr:amidase [Bacteroidota bacterium]
MEKVSLLSLSRTIEELRNGTLLPEAFIHSLCDRIEQLDPVIHSLLPENNRRERLIREACELDQKYPSPSNRPELFCIPVGVKDMFRADGFHTKAGSDLPDSLFTGTESSAVSILKRAGALVLGKTITTEFAYFESGSTCNPHKLTHTPGGSSSGSAAAVAAGFTPLALGTQTIGSITRPASFCGVYGFKPSMARVPADGVIPFSPSADHIGFFTNDLQGIIIAAGLLCYDWKLASSLPSRKPVLGIPTGTYLQQADETVLNFFEEQIDLMEQKGCTIIRLDAFRDIEAINRAHRSIVSKEFAAVHKEWYASYESLYRKASRDLILEGMMVAPAAYKTALEGMKSLRAHLWILKLQHHIDLWLSPSSCTAAPEGLDSTGSPLMNLPWTYMGLPTLSVPSGKTTSQLPLGLQFATSFMEDEMLLKWVNGLGLESV